VSTNSLTAAILLFLRLQGHLAYRVNTSGVYDPQRKIVRSRIDRGSVGVTDIVCCVKPRGLYLGVEVKTGKDQIRWEQALHAQRVTDAGGLHYIAKSIDDFMIWYDENIKPLASTECTKPTKRKR
jgi:hypothetical protein